MTDENLAVPRSFRVVGILALLWNLLGTAAYVMQVTMTEEALMAYSEDQRMLYTNIPAWATSAFATAVTAGTIGSVLLLLRNSWAVPAFLVSLAAVLVQLYHAFVLSNTIEVLGPVSVVQPALVLAFACALIWYSRAAKEKGWLT